MECPVCGCCVEEPKDRGQFLVECACCETLWVVAAETLKFDRALVGPEG